MEGAVEGEEVFQHPSNNKKRSNTIKKKKKPKKFKYGNDRDGF